MTKAAVSRVVGASASTISRWLAKAAAHARVFHEVNTRPTDAAEVQMDELACKGSAAARRAWTFSAIEVSSRLWLGLRVAPRTLRDTKQFVREVRETLTSTVGGIIVTSDAFKYYPKAMRKVFEGQRVVYMTVDNKYQGGRVVRSIVKRVMGPDWLYDELRGRSESKKPNTSFIERMNLCKRMCCSFLRRRNPAPARKPESIQEALELVRAIYNYVRPHSSLATRQGKRTPAMAAGLTTRPLAIRDILGWVAPPSYWRQRALEQLFARCRW